jgi:hypothetical protein
VATLVASGDDRLEGNGKATTGKYVGERGIADVRATRIGKLDYTAQSACDARHVATPDRSGI